MDSEIDIVPFTQQHLNDVVRLSAQNNWPHREEDWALMLSVSEGFVAVFKGRVIGTAMTTLYGDDAAATNMIIVDKDMQGRGLGRRLMDKVLTLSDGRENRLVATEVGLPLYAKLGFEVTGRITQHQGILKNPSASGGDCVWDDAPDRDVISALDRRACGLDRHRLMAALINIGRVAVARDGDDIRGCAILRDFGRGKVVGPVVCGDTTTARQLLGFVLSSHAGEFMRVDVPAESGLYDWISDLGLTHVGEHVRMTLHQRQVHRDDQVRTYALVSQALG